MNANDFLGPIDDTALEHLHAGISKTLYAKAVRRSLEAVGQTRHARPTSRASAAQSMPMLVVLS
jgi:hypothetical protein